MQSKEIAGIVCGKSCCHTLYSDISLFSHLDKLEHCTKSCYFVHFLAKDVLWTKHVSLCWLFPIKQLSSPE